MILKIYRYGRIKKLIKDNPEIMENANDVGWFLNWLKSNEHILKEFMRYSRFLKKEGKRDYYSARAIIQKMRWDTFFQEEGTEYKIGNNATPYMARLVMFIYPEMKGMFSIRNNK